MDEQRLIDANKLLEKQECLYMRGNILFHGVTAHSIENAPTINPEDLPIVQQLQEELARVTAELYEARESCEATEKKYAVCAQRLRQTQYCYDIAKNSEQQLRRQVDEITGKWAECAKKLNRTSEQLEQMTAERDAAVKDIEQAIDIYRDDEGWDLLCRFCNGKSCREKKECTPEWRGLKKEG